MCTALRRLGLVCEGVFNHLSLITLHFYHVSPFAFVVVHVTVPSIRCIYSSPQLRACDIESRLYWICLAQENNSDYQHGSGALYLVPPKSSL